MADDGPHSETGSNQIANPVSGMEKYNPDSPDMKIGKWPFYVKGSRDGDHKIPPVTILKSAVEDILTVDRLNFYKEAQNSLGEFSDEFQILQILINDYINEKERLLGPLTFRKCARWILRNHKELINGLNRFLPTDLHISDSSPTELPSAVFLDFVKLLTKTCPTNYERKIIRFLEFKSELATGNFDKKSALYELSLIFCEEKELLLEFSYEFKYSSTAGDILLDIDSHQISGNPVSGVEAYDPDFPDMKVGDRTIYNAYNIESKQLISKIPVVEPREVGKDVHHPNFIPGVGLVITKRNDPRYPGYILGAPQRRKESKKSRSSVQSKEIKLEEMLNVPSRNYFNEVRHLLGEFSEEFNYFRMLVIDYCNKKKRLVGNLKFRSCARWVLRNHTYLINGLNSFLPKELHISDAIATEQPCEILLDFLKLIMKAYPQSYETKILEFLEIKSDLAAGYFDRKYALRKLEELFYDQSELLLEFLYEFKVHGDHSHHIEDHLLSQF